MIADFNEAQLERMSAALQADGAAAASVSNNADSTLISSSAWRAHVAEAIVDGVENYRTLAEKKSRPKVIADYRRAAVSNVNLR